MIIRPTMVNKRTLRISILEDRIEVVGEGEVDLTGTHHVSTTTVLVDNSNSQVKNKAQIQTLRKIS